MKWALELWARPQPRSQPEDPPGDEFLAQLLSSSGPLPADLADRVREVYRSWVAAAGKRTLEECHGWKPEQSAGRTLARRLGEYAQEKAIADAYGALGVNDEASPWKKCELLRQETLDFECVYWNTWRHSGPPAGKLSEIHDALFRAYMALPNKPPPKSTRGIYALLKRAGVLT